MIRLSLVVFALAVFLTQLGCAAHTGSGTSAGDGLAQVNISPTSLSFGTVQSGSYVTRSEQLENTGNLPIFVFSTAVHGAGFDFNCPNLPLELKPQSKLLCKVGFRPQAPAKYAGKIIVWFKWRAEDTSDNGELRNDQPSGGSLPRRERWKWEERDVPIAAVAASSGELRVSFSAINFGDVTVGSTKKQEETLYAAGGPVTVSSATVDNAEFAMSGISLPVTIPAGHTASLIMAFTPESPGAATGALTLDSSAINSNAQVRITGTGMGTPGVQHSVSLSWGPSTSADVIGYNIYRGTQSGGPYSQVNSSPDSNTTATDDHVSAGQTYYYVVTTVNSAGLESSYSNQASAMVPSP